MPEDSRRDLPRGSGIGKELINFQVMIDAGTISAGDLELFKMVDSPKKASESDKTASANTTWQASKKEAEVLLTSPDPPAPDVRRSDPSSRSSRARASPPAAIARLTNLDSFRTQTDTDIPAGSLNHAISGPPPRNDTGFRRS